MISNKIKKNIENSSWIRAMFEKGSQLTAKYGKENVYDFSLGNPDPEPPEALLKRLEMLAEAKIPKLHSYMPNAGYMDTRMAIAKQVSLENDIETPFENIVMTCGAGGALNVLLKSVLNPGDEVIVFAPYFVEYNFYTENHNGIPVKVEPNPPSFQPNVEDFKNKINEKTRAIILNSPNNPSGVVYTEEVLKELAVVVEDTENKYGTKILVISDEPYRKISYDDVTIPSVFKIFKNVAIADSYSKSLSIPGERIGYVAVSPNTTEASLLIEAVIFSNRTLGYVNAPSLFQKVITDCQGSVVDINLYKERRDFFYKALTDIGYECIKPQGAFYLFPKAPGGNDIDFANKALDYNIILVPGTGFGCPGYIRIAYCVSMETIKNSIESFRKLFEEYK